VQLLWLFGHTHRVFCIVIQCGFSVQSWGLPTSPLTQHLQPLLPPRSSHLSRAPLRRPSSPCPPRTRAPSLTLRGPRSCVRRPSTPLVSRSASSVQRCRCVTPLLARQRLLSTSRSPTPSRSTSSPPRCPRCLPAPPPAPAPRPPLPHQQ